MVWMDFDALAASTLALVTKSKRWISISYFFSSFCEKDFSSNSAQHADTHISILCQWIHPYTSFTVCRTVLMSWFGLHHREASKIKSKIECFGMAMENVLYSWEHVDARHHSIDSAHSRFRWHNRNLTELSSDDLLAMSTVHFIWSDNWRLLFLMRFPTVWWALNSCHYLLYLSAQVLCTICCYYYPIKTGNEQCKMNELLCSKVVMYLLNSIFPERHKSIVYNGKWLAASAMPRFVFT